jgi:hypothetical protein
MVEPNERIKITELSATKQFIFRFSAELPSISTMQTIDKSRHRFICTSRL